MKRLSSNQQGIGFVAVLVLVLVVGVIGAVGYKVTNKTAAPSTAAVFKNAKAPAKLSNTADVTKADKALDTEANDSAVDPSSLDNDLNSLL